MIGQSTLWEQAPPAQRNFVIRPGFDDIRSRAGNDVEVITHDRKPKDFDSEDPGENFQSNSNPLLAMREVFARPPISSAQVSTANAPIDQVKRLNVVRSTNLGSVERGIVKPLKSGELQ